MLFAAERVRIWSALASIIPTLRPFAHEPGFLAATVTPVDCFHHIQVAHSAQHS
jgi:hypothetical protein